MTKDMKYKPKFETTQDKMNRDPKFRKMMLEKEDAHQKGVEQNRLEQLPLAEELNAIGEDVGHVARLIGRDKLSEEAAQILIRHYSFDHYSKWLKEGIMRSLAKKNLSGVINSQLLKMFADETHEELRWIIGNTLQDIAVREDYDAIMKLLLEKKYGNARSSLIHTLVTIKATESIPHLIPLLDDDSVVAETIEVLAKLKAKDALEKIEALITHPDSWISGKAKKAAKKLKK